MAQPGFEERLAFDVQSERIVDLRDAAALVTLGSTSPPPGGGRRPG
ncbi:hypothetical protein M3C89_004760 [Micrococcus luteus]|nr:hypothetical protein [Micrococcus luteus]MCV7720809.1 hypothetical protein [Micrococcus luteus]MCV7740521.1 hypothetical protein [Micrococcus luteus]